MKLHTTVLRKDSDCLFQTAHIPALAVVDDVAHQANKRRVDVGDGPYMHEAEALADSCCKIAITLIMACAGHLSVIASHEKAPRCFPGYSPAAFSVSESCPWS